MLLMCLSPLCYNGNCSSHCMYYVSPFKFLRNRFGNIEYRPTPMCFVEVYLVLCCFLTWAQNDRYELNARYAALRVPVPIAHI